MSGKNYIWGHRYYFEFEFNQKPAKMGELGGVVKMLQEQKDHTNLGKLREKPKGVSFLI